MAIIQLEARNWRVNVRHDVYRSIHKLRLRESKNRSCTIDVKMDSISGLKWYATGCNEHESLTGRITWKGAIVELAM